MRMSDEHDAALAVPYQTLATERLTSAATGRRGGASLLLCDGAVDAGAASRGVEHRR